MARTIAASVPTSLPKVSSGIAGIDSVTGGGWPHGRTTLIEGGAGSGKTLMSLSFLVEGARRGHSGIFVSFEESPLAIRRNAATLGWHLDRLPWKRIRLVDGRPSPDHVYAGTFDLGGLLAMLESHMRQSGARRMVIDALDVLLALMPDEQTKRREVYRLHEWLLSHQVTTVITAKSAGGRADSILRFLPFLVDSAVCLDHDAVGGVSQRNVRVIKYRGSSFAENASPMTIGPAGINVAAAVTREHSTSPVSNERFSTGVTGLDEMLDGGFYKGTSVLMTGSPGTAKTTLAGAFASAACARGERTLFFSFDSDGGELVRNLRSVNIRLGPWLRRGLLRIVSARAVTANAETHLMTIRTHAEQHRATCLVVDPLSALVKEGHEAGAHGAAERVVDWAKSAGLTVLCTSLLGNIEPTLEGTPLGVSTIADTWIHLSYLVQGGERNRGISIVKSRGTAHSNQVRELVLSNTGVRLADVFTAGGEVLMGTRRWEREQQVTREEIEHARAESRRLADVSAEEASLEAQIKALTRALLHKRDESTAIAEGARARISAAEGRRVHLRGLRGEK